MQELRVLALATNIPGPLAAEALARRGARVTKVEPPQGDPLQAAAPQWYERVCSVMEVVRLDLKAAADRARFEELLGQSDVLITTLRPRALARAGLAWDDLHTSYPRLCQVAVVGEDGASADHAGHDLTYQARAGLLSPPHVPRAVYADMLASERVLAAAYELLYERSANGRSAFRQIAIAQCAAGAADALRYGLTSADGPLGGGSALYRLYQTADGWIALAALEPHFQANLRAALNLEALDGTSLERSFARQPNRFWEELAQEHDLPIASAGAL